MHRSSWFSVLLACLVANHAANAEPRPFTATLEIRASADAGFEFPLLSTSGTGVADVTGGFVKIPAGVLSELVPAMAGFGGTVVNGPLTFSASGVGAGQICSFIAIQELCWDGGGFGGVMRLDGITRSGVPFEPFGEPGTGQSGIVEGGPWTTGSASVFYFIPETDPTPFAIIDAGSFRGLPSTEPANAGFSTVTPAMLTTNLAGSTGNARISAKLRIDFPKAVPLGVAGSLAPILAALGVAAALRGRRHRS